MEYSCSTCGHPLTCRGRPPATNARRTASQRSRPPQGMRGCPAGRSERGEAALMSLGPWNKSGAVLKRQFAYRRSCATASTARLYIFAGVCCCKILQSRKRWGCCLSTLSPSPSPDPPPRPTRILDYPPEKGRRFQTRGRGVRDERAPGRCRFAASWPRPGRGLGGGRARPCGP